MRDFSKILDATLGERIEVEKKQEELAEEIIEAAIKSFTDISVNMIWISIDDTKKIIEIKSIEGVIKTFSDLCYGKRVFDNIKQILTSEHFEEIDLVKNHIYMEIPSAYDDIIIKLNECA